MQLISDQSLALIIDDQIRLLPSIADGELMMRNTGILIQGLRILDIPMLITQQYTKGLGMSDPSIYLHTGTMEYLEKRTFSCWKMTPFAVASKPPAAVRLSSLESKHTSAYFKQPWILFMPATKPSW